MLFWIAISSLAMSNLAISVLIDQSDCRISCRIPVYIIIKNKVFYNCTFIVTGLTSTMPMDSVTPGVSSFVTASMPTFITIPTAGPSVPLMS